MNTGFLVYKGWQMRDDIENIRLYLCYHHHASLRSPVGWLSNEPIVVSIEPDTS